MYFAIKSIYRGSNEAYRVKKYNHFRYIKQMDKTGDYYIAVPQIANLIQIPIHHASRDFKALLAKDFQLTKGTHHSKTESMLATESKTRNPDVTEEFNYVKLKTSLHPKAVHPAMLLKTSKLYSVRIHSSSMNICKAENFFKSKSSYSKLPPKA